MTDLSPSLAGRLKAYLVHLYTATGIIWAVMAAFAIVSGELAVACLWLMLAMAVDSTDGFFARRFHVKTVLPALDGRKLDDIVDYLNYTFLPILLISSAGRLPEPRLLWAAIPLVTSLFAFCNRRAKEEQAGFFLGFPSYWNVIGVYFVIWLSETDVLITGCIILAFSVLTVLPLRFVYPSHAPRWKRFFVGGAIAWMVLICFMLAHHPSVPSWMIWISLSYPAMYLVLSVYLDYESRGNQEAGTRCQESAAQAPSSEPPDPKPHDARHIP
jgi:phosphatidylcholine synthase